MRFLRADGTLIGTAGGLDSREALAKDSREPASVAPCVRVVVASAPGAKDSREPAKPRSEPGTPARAGRGGRIGCPSPEQDALVALKNLEFPVRRAKSILREVLAEQPAARAEELVKAVLLKHYTTRSA